MNSTTAIEPSPAVAGQVVAAVRFRARLAGVSLSNKTNVLIDNHLQQRLFPAQSVASASRSTLSMGLAHAQIVIEAWRREYNEDRPKKGLGGLTPAH